MTTKDIDDINDIDFARHDSRVIIRISATKKESLGYNRGKESRDRYGEEELFFETEGELILDQRLGNNIVNIDSYFDPDYTYDYRNQYEANDAVYSRHTTEDFRFDVWTGELREAAKVRASEDSTEAIRVLAEWLHRAGGADHVKASDANIFYNALRKEIEDTDDPVDWALAFGGDPDEWWHDEDPVTTLEEARIYARGGFKHVTDARTEVDQ